MEIFCYLGVEMKNYYKINEIAQLYGISTDSLRYYERLGILHPRRDTNGYRLYDLKDMYKLTVIRDLRQLDFPMAKIKDYLEAQCVDHTLSMLQQEQQLLEEKICEIRRRQKLLAERIGSLETTRRAVPGEIKFETLPSRKCVRLNQYITRDEEMDFVIKKLQRAMKIRLKNWATRVSARFSQWSIFAKVLPMFIILCLLCWRLDRKTGILNCRQEHMPHVFIRAAISRMRFRSIA